MSEDNQANPITSGVATGRTVFDFGYDLVSKLWEGLVRYGTGSYQDGSVVRELKKSLGE